MKKLAYDAGRAFAMGLAYAKGLRFAQTHKLATDAKWITVHPYGKRDRRGDKIKGIPVLIDEESGKILGGIGSSPSKPKTLTKGGKVKEETKKDADNEVSITYEDQQKQDKSQEAQVKTAQEQPKQNSAGDVIEGTNPSDWGEKGSTPEGEAEISYGKKTPSYGGVNPLIDSTPKYFFSAIRPTDKSYKNYVHGLEPIRGITASPTEDTPGFKTFVNYTGNGYKAINKHFRKGEHLDSARQEGCKQMDAFMNEHRTTEPMRVYRGIPQDAVDIIEQTGVYFDKGYSSTSATPSVAKSFGHKAIMVLHVPKGYPCAFMEDITQVSGEDEILLARNMKAKVIECKVDKDGYKIFHMKVHPND